MKLTSAILLMSLTSMPWAAAQSAITMSNEEPAANAREQVYEAGDLIEKDAAPTTERSSAVATDGVLFFEGFASETSEEALLKQVEKSILKDPEHACEIVKEAIVISRADEALVAKIVETACLAAPEKMRIIAQCAIAAYPDGLAAVQQVLAKLDPATGNGDKASSKSGKETLEKGGIDKTPIAPVERKASPIDYLPPVFPPYPPTINPPPATDNRLR
jgi:hypothetical protein